MKSEIYFATFWLFMCKVYGVNTAKIKPHKVNECGQSAYFTVVDEAADNAAVWLYKCIGIGLEYQADDFQRKFCWKFPHRFAADMYKMFFKDMTEAQLTKVYEAALARIRKRKAANATRKAATIAAMKQAAQNIETKEVK